MRKKLDQKEVEELAKKIESQFGFRINTAYTYLTKQEKQGLKIFLYTSSKMPEIEAAWIGLHFGTIVDGLFCPSIEGAMLMKTAGKNTIEVSRQEMEELMKGNHIPNKKGFSGYLIVKSGDLACAASSDESNIASLVPNSRRI